LSLFATPGKLSDSDLEVAATEVGVDLALYNPCRASGAAGQYVQADRSEAVGLKVPATPTFYFGRLTPDRRVQISDVITGAGSIEAFDRILGRLLKASG
jgi:hypothetical protein